MKGTASDQTVAFSMLRRLVHTLACVSVSGSARVSFRPLGPLTGSGPHSKPVKMVHGHLTRAVVTVGWHPRLMP